MTDDIELAAALAAATERFNEAWRAATEAGLRVTMKIAAEKKVVVEIVRDLHNLAAVNQLVSQLRTIPPVPLPAPTIERFEWRYSEEGDRAILAIDGEEVAFLSVLAWGLDKGGREVFHVCAESFYEEGVERAFEGPVWRETLEEACLLLSEYYSLAISVPARWGAVGLNFGPIDTAVTKAHYDEVERQEHQARLARQRQIISAVRDSVKNVTSAHFGGDQSRLFSEWQRHTLDIVAAAKLKPVRTDRGAFNAVLRGQGSSVGRIALAVVLGSTPFLLWPAGRLESSGREREEPPIRNVREWQRVVEGRPMNDTESDPQCPQCTERMTLLVAEDDGSYRWSCTRKRCKSEQ